MYKVRHKAKKRGGLILLVTEHAQYSVCTEHAQYSLQHSYIEHCTQCIPLGSEVCQMSRASVFTPAAEGFTEQQQLDKQLTAIQ